MAVHLFTYYSRRCFVPPTGMAGMFMNSIVHVASGKSALEGATCMKTVGLNSGRTKQSRAQEPMHQNRVTWS